MKNKFSNIARKPFYFINKLIAGFRVALLGDDMYSRMILLYYNFLPFLAKKIKWFDFKERKVTIKKFGRTAEIYLSGFHDEYGTLKEIFSREEYDIDAQPEVIFDLGSNVGFSVIYFALKYPQAEIFGFEPDPYNFSKLKKNISLLPSVKAYNLAVAGQNGERDFFPYPGKSISSSLTKRLNNQRAIKIKTKSLDSLLVDLNIEKIDLLKIDVEGAEYEILSNFKSKERIGAIIGELHMDLMGASLEEFKNTLPGYDFKFSGAGKGKRLFFKAYNHEFKKIKIVFGLPSFAAGGGIEQQLLQQLYVYKAEKYEIHLITLFYVTDRPHLYDKLPPHIKYSILNFRGYFNIKNYFKLYRELKSIKPDIVITSMFPANAVFRILKPLFKYKIATREHNTYTDKTKFHNIAERLLEPLSNKIVAVSEGVADFFSRQAGIKREKIMVINNGIDLSKIEDQKANLKDYSEIKKELGFRSEDKIILNIARLKPQKNHQLLLKSFKIFSENHMNHKLVILGIGSEMENLKKLVKDLNLSEKAFLMGYRDDVHKFYFISDMFVLTSKIEGFPNVLLEAMAYGVPVVTTEVAGVKEMINEGKNGFVVNSDPEEIAKKMEIMSKSPASFKRFCENTAKEFDINKIVEKYEKLINSLI